MRVCLTVSNGFVKLEEKTRKHCGHSVQQNNNRPPIVAMVDPVFEAQSKWRVLQTRVNILSHNTSLQASVKNKHKYD